MPAGLGTADIAIGVLIVVSAFFGVMRGLVRELMSLVIWIAALLLGLAFGSQVGGLIDSLGPRLQAAAGFAMVFIVVLIVGALVQRLLGGLVESTGLTGTDRTLGLLFGAARGVAVAVVALVLLKPFAVERDWWADSLLVPPLISLEADVMALANAVLDLLAPGQPAREEGV